MSTFPSPREVISRPRGRPRVLFVSQFTYPADEEIRVTKLSKTLIDLGYECAVACPGQVHSVTPPDSMGVKVLHLLPVTSAWGERLAKPFPGNLLWLIWLIMVCLRMRPDVIVLRNVRAALDCVICAGLIRSRLVADLSENYGALYALGEKRWRNPWNAFVAMVARGLESLAARHAHGVMVVCEENRERLQSLRAGKAPPVIVGNLPAANEFVHRDVRSQSSCGLRLIYLGLLDRFRAIDVVLHALAMLGRRNIELQIVGDGSERSRFEALAQRLSIPGRVEFRGRVPRHEALQLIRSADVGVIPHVQCELTESTLPNKLYDYFAAGLPIITTSTGPLRRELQLANAGLAISNDVAAWSDAIAQLQESPLLASALGMNGFRFAAQHRTWESNLPTLRAVFGPQG